MASQPFVYGYFMLSSCNDEEICFERKNDMIMLEEILLNFSLLVLKMKIETYGLFLYLITFLCVGDFI